MKHTISVFLLVLIALISHGQSTDTWIIEAKNIDAANYYGVTVANGMIGLVSSPDPMKVKDVVLNVVYDYYQRGRVSSILKTFNRIDLNPEVDEQMISQANISSYQQSVERSGHHSTCF